jgi:hypothetical protein
MLLPVYGTSAVEWSCTNCGTTQFSSMVDIELTEEDLDEDPTLIEHEDGYCKAPATVKCDRCGERYSLVFGMEGDDHFEDDDDDEDDDLEIDEIYEDD